MRRVDERGFTLTELLVGCAVSLVVTGAAGVLATGLQRVAAAVDREQVARMDAAFTLDAVVRVVEQAGSFPYGEPSMACTGGGPPEPLRLDPGGDGRPDDLRVRMDVNPANGWLGGYPGTCDETGEDVTLALDRAAGTVTRRDATGAGSPLAISDAGVTDLRFELLDGAGGPVTRAADAQAVRVTLTMASASGLDPRPRTHRALVRLRER